MKTSSNYHLNKMENGKKRESEISNSEDKLFEHSFTDSGFISSGNLIISEEIKDEDVVCEERDCNLEKNNVHTDSGVLCLSEEFSNINLQSSLNDLSNKTNQSDCSKINIDKTVSELPWQIYYQQDEDGDTHLHLAISDSLLEVACALIRMAPHPRFLDTPNDDALTPLHIAVATRQWPIVRLLIIAGARPGPRNLSGNSPLHLASIQNDVESCKAILYPVRSQERDQLKLSYPPQICPNLNIEQWNYNGQTCVHIAAQQGHVEILRHLVWYGADINSREGREGYTALHYAVKRNDEQLLDFLINECSDKIDLKKTTYGGSSALQLGFPIKKSIFTLLEQNDIESYYSSEDDESEDERPITVDELHRYRSASVNA